jgi:hypothetical protein
MHPVLGSVILGNLRQNFLLHFLAETHFTHDCTENMPFNIILDHKHECVHTHQHNNNQYLT